MCDVTFDNLNKTMNHNDRKAAFTVSDYFCLEQLCLGQALKDDLLTDL